jgi:hypothetical protein
VGSTRRAGRQCPRGVVRPAGDRAGMRADLRGQPSGLFRAHPSPAHPWPARPAEGIGPEPHRQPGVGGPPLRLQGHEVERPPGGRGLCGDGRLFAVEARQHPVRPGHRRPLQSVFGTAAVEPKFLLLVIPFPFPFTFVVWGADEFARWLRRRLVDPSPGVRLAEPQGIPAQHQPARASGGTLSAMSTPGMATVWWIAT